MRCPECDAVIISGAEICETCGQDLLDTGVPRGEGGIQEKILSDPLSRLEPAPPVMVASSVPAAEAIRSMKEKRHGSVLVVDGGRLVGLFTERDVLLKLAGRLVDLEKIPVGAVMTAEPATLSEEDPVAFAVHLMAVRGLRHIPVLRDGKPVGVVSIRGVIRYLTEQAL